MSGFKKLYNSLLILPSFGFATCWRFNKSWIPHNILLKQGLVIKHCTGQSKQMHTFYYRYHFQGFNAKSIVQTQKQFLRGFPSRNAPTRLTTKCFQEKFRETGSYRITVASHSHPEQRKSRCNCETMLGVVSKETHKTNCPRRQIFQGVQLCMYALGSSPVST